MALATALESLPPAAAAWAMEVAVAPGLAWESHSQVAAQAQVMHLTT
jgi:hypothetical protein